MNTRYCLILFVILAAGMSSCEKETPNNTLQFEMSRATLSTDVPALTIRLTLERPAEDNIPITVDMQTLGITHKNQFVVSPESVEVNGTLFLAFPKGATETSFTITKLGNPVLSGGETIVFSIVSATNPVIMGQPSTMEIHFQ